MNKVAKRTLNIKRLVLSNITHDKTAWVRFIVGITFNDFSSGYYVFNFLKRYPSRIAAPLSMPCDYVLFFNKLLMDLSEHLIILYHKGLTLSRNNSIASRKIGTGNGVMTASFDTTAGAYHNYYNWTGNSSNQTYDIYVRVLLPEDFGTWDSSAAITYYTNIDATPGNTGVTLTVYDTGDNSSYAGTKVQTAGWASNTVGSASLTGTYADGDWMTLKFTMTADSSKNAKLGEVTLKYNRE